MSALEVAERLTRALEARDVEGTRACFHPDAGIWHNYDGKTQTVDENMAVFEWMIANCSALRYEIRRLEELRSGYLQQHTLRLVAKDGRAFTTEAIAVVTVESGRIRKIEEYLDPSPVAALAG